MDDSLCTFTYLYLSAVISNCILVQRGIADMGYTKYETKILNGIIPVDKVVKLDTLQKLFDKALKAEDTDAIQKVLPRLNYLKKVYESGYTESQYKIITGETKDVTGQVANRLLYSAQKKNDTDVIKLAQSLIALSKQKAVENNRIRARERMHKLWHGEIIEWQEPKNNEYSEKQKRIVRGEIPLEEVHTNTLINIHQKAKNKGDIELSERILSLIIDRRMIDQKNTLRRIRYLRNNGGGGSSLKRLTPWQQRVLEGESDDCMIEELEHILAICEHRGYKDEAVFVSTILFYRKHPEELYITKDKNAAIDAIERMMHKPIKRPESWFK